MLTEEDHLSHGGRDGAARAGGVIGWAGLIMMLVLNRDMHDRPCIGGL